MATPFEKRFTAQSADIDIMGHVNNAVWVRWIEEVATAHWFSLVARDASDRHGWVVTRHEIDYRGNVAVGETVTARTWIAEPARGARIVRLVEFHGADGALKVAARTSWAMIDLESRRAVRIPPEITALFLA